MSILLDALKKAAKERQNAVAVSQDLSNPKWADIDAPLSHDAPSDDPSREALDGHARRNRVIQDSSGTGSSDTIYDEVDEETNEKSHEEVHKMDHSSDLSIESSEELADLEDLSLDFDVENELLENQIDEAFEADIRTDQESEQEDALIDALLIIDEDPNAVAKTTDAKQSEIARPHPTDNDESPDTSLTARSIEHVARDRNAEALQAEIERELGYDVPYLAPELDDASLARIQEELDAAELENIPQLTDIENAPAELYTRSTMSLAAERSATRDPARANTSDDLQSNTLEENAANTENSSNNHSKNDNQAANSKQTQLAPKENTSGPVPPSVRAAELRTQFQAKRSKAATNSEQNTKQTKEHKRNKSSANPTLDKLIHEIGADRQSTNYYRLGILSISLIAALGCFGLYYYMEYIFVEDEFVFNFDRASQPQPPLGQTFTAAPRESQEASPNELITALNSDENTAPSATEPTVNTQIKQPTETNFEAIQRQNKDRLLARKARANRATNSAKETIEAPVGVSSTTTPQTNNPATPTPTYKPVVAKRPPVKRQSKRIEQARASSDKRSPLQRTLDDAFALFHQNNLPEAKLRYDRALAIDEGNRNALLGLGAIATKQADYERALELYKGLLVTNPTDDLAQTGFLQVSNNFNLIQLESQLKFYIEQSPKSAFLRFSLGNVYVNRGQWQQASALFEQAVLLDTTNPDFLYNFAVSLDQQGKEADALLRYQQALNVSQGRNIGFSVTRLQDRIATLQSNVAVESGVRGA